MKRIHVKAGRAKALWKGHPWVFADSIARIETAATSDDPADWVEVVDAEGRVVGHGLLSERSAIRVRLLDQAPTPSDLPTLLGERIAEAVALRARLFPVTGDTNAYRLVHAEGDRLPGLVVDRFGDVLVAQFATGPMHARREALATLLLDATGARSLVARSAGFEKIEGIDPAAPPFAAGEPAPDAVEISESGCPFTVEPQAGQKTGHYCDQRENRLLVAGVAKDLDVLDLYAGTGGFSLQALRSGARQSLAVDTSARSLGRAAESGQRANVGDRLQTEVGDVTAVLRALRDAGRTFDLVIADPPNFFPRRGPPRGAPKAHRELNVRALARVAASGGFLASFSCSPRLDAEGLLAMLRSAARECRRSFSVLRPLVAGPDHPVGGMAPEGRYLSGYLLRVHPVAQPAGGQGGGP